jgi:anaerobic selenocysteine-containing dehydrogenase
MQEALDAVAKSLDNESLLWRGSGNFGVMQEVTDLLFEKLGATLTKGSLCDGAGDAGIIEGRGVNRTLPLETIEKSEVVIVWGRNISTTNSHLMPYLEGKKIVVVDPVRTALAKKADLHIQIEPRSDIYLLLILSRFLFMEDSEDKEWMDEHASEYEEFYDFTRTFRIKAILEHLELGLHDIGALLSYLKEDKVVILAGNGLQKYSIGHSVLWSLDSLAVSLGLFAREGCGVSYLGNSKLGFENPFAVNTSRVSKVNTAFKDFKTVVVQGGNPVESMPNSSRVMEELESVQNIIYFGLYENETSKRANIVIPAKSFFEKDDLRLSYGHHAVSRMRTIVNSDIGLSEYEFTKELYLRLGFDGLKEEQEYIDEWLEQCDEVGGAYRSPAYQSQPHADGFGQEGGDEFIFIDDFEDDFINSKHLRKYRKLNKNKMKPIEFWLITPKAKHAMNTQFKRSDVVGLHPDLGYSDGERVLVSSAYGEYRFVVKNNSDLRIDCLLITANTIGVNYLTPPTISEEGESACYQEIKVTLTSIV